MSQRRYLDDCLPQTLTGKKNQMISVAENEIELQLIESRWDDLRFPAQGITLGGIVSPPGADGGTLLFDGDDSVEAIGGVAQMPHTWVEGTSIRPHVHWSKSADGTGDVIWTLRYRWANPGDVFPAWSETIVGVTAVASGDLADQHAITGFGEIDGTGKLLSSIFLWQLGRLPTDENDTYADDARLYEFDIHYLVNGIGSTSEFQK
jgi:hypothetical protein